jgi:hypothetical protein
MVMIHVLISPADVQTSNFIGVYRNSNSSEVDKQGGEGHDYTPVVQETAGRSRFMYNCSEDNTICDLEGAQEKCCCNMLRTTFTRFQSKERSLFIGKPSWDGLSPTYCTRRLNDESCLNRKSQCFYLYGTSARSASCLGHPMTPSAKYDTQLWGVSRHCRRVSLPGLQRDRF